MADFDLTGQNIPYRLDAEQAVLGAILADSTAVMADVAVKLQPEHFYVEIHKSLYAVMLSMSLGGEGIDPVTVLDRAMRQGIFETAEQAREYIHKLMESSMGYSMVEAYVNIIADKYIMRSLLFAAREIMESVNSGSEDANTLVDMAEQKIFDIRNGSEVKGLTHISGIVLDRINALDELTKRASESGEPVMTGLSSMYRELDKRISGLNKSDLIILAARPGMGKTSFALNIATNVCKKQPDKAAVVFSLEMSKEQIVSRMISSEASLSSQEMKTGEISNAKWKDVGRAADILSSLEIYIDDTAGINIAGIKSKLRRVKNLGVVIIDYLQLMSSVKNYGGNRVLEISDITRNLKIMAKELNVPVICLSQLARGTEQRTDKRPLLSDLRESGSIEQDADIVMFLYRNAYYDKTDPQVNVCECIIAKNRQGEPGTILLGWDGEYTRFTNAAFNIQEQPQ